MWVTHQDLIINSANEWQKMKAYSVSGITKSGRDMEFEIRAKCISQAMMVAGVYFEFYAIMGAK